MKDTDTNVSATALKALTVLDFLGEQRSPVAVSDVVSGMGIDRTTAYRMLMTLVKSGYVVRTNEKTYRLGARVVSLVRHVINEDERSQKITGTMRAIAEETGETVHYSVLENEHIILLFRAKGTQRVAVDFAIGDRTPIHCSSVGKVLLAFGDEAVVQQVIDRGLPKVAPNTITEPDDLRAALSQIRSENYAFDDRELAADMRCISAPVIEHGGHVSGGLSISGPASRFDQAKLEELRDVVLRHAERLSTELGGQWPD